MTNLDKAPQIKVGGGVKNVFLQGLKQKFTGSIILDPPKQPDPAGPYPQSCWCSSATNMLVV